MAITVKHTKVSTIPDGDDSSLIRPSDWNDDHTLIGLGTMAEQNANNVSITGGSITGTTVSGYIPTTEKGVANGVATLDSNGQVPLSQIPPLGDLNYQGTWNASTNTPTLTSSVGTKGYYYVVSVAGTTNLNGITDWQIGDWAVYNGTAWQKVDNTDTLTSVGITTSAAALAVTNSPLTSNGNIGVNFSGLASQYVRGDGALANFPTSTGGGSSVSYYMNGGTNQGTFGGNTYYQINKTAVIGTAANFSISADGYIAQFITDANDPALLNIPIGNWNFEMYFSASSSGGTPSFYVELYKYNGTTFTLIASNSTTPESISNGTAVDLYLTSLAVPSTSLTITDRLAVRVYVNHSGRTITLHTQDNTLGQIITTFSTGITALNGLTSQVQYFATGTSGSDFNISSATDTHTFNIPSASSTNRGLLTSTDWTTFNNKGSVSSVAATAGTGISITGSPITSSGTLTITNTAPDQTVSLTGTGTTTVTGTYPNFTINSADQYTGTVTSVNLTAGTGISVSGGPITSSGSISVTNTAPDQVVSITGAGTTTVTGTYPNFTVTSNDQYVGTVTSVGTGTGLTGGPITGSGTISLANTTVSAGSYTNASLTVDAQGRLTAASSGTAPVTSVTGTAPVVSSGGTTPAISMPKATGSVDGYLSSTDWTTFNNKGSGTVTSVSALTLGTSGTDLSSTVANGTTTPVITLNVPTASATNRGALSAADWTTFNSKANAFTYTTNYIPYGQGTTTPTQSANLTFDGTTQTAPIQRASNGIVTNNKTIGTSFTIPSTDNAMSSGPVTLSAGVTVTVSSGSRWVVL